jgi:hypothetical protein
MEGVIMQCHMTWGIHIELNTLFDHVIQDGQSALLLPSLENSFLATS